MTHDVPNGWPELTVLIGTRNRLPVLRKCLDALRNTVQTPHRVVVIDAGSTDGTVDYVRGLSGICLRCDGKPLGQAQSLNRVLEEVDSKYVCWISDDNIVQKDWMDRTVAILRESPHIGMVALKVRNVGGSRIHPAYIGGLGEAGILTCNQGMLPQALFRQIGFFDPVFRDYGIDVDVTAKVLLSGYSVVFTKGVTIHHLRDIETFPGAIENRERATRLARSFTLFEEKYPFLNVYGVRAKVWRLLCRIACDMLVWCARFSGRDREAVDRCLRNARNVLCGRYISKLDGWKNRHRFYHLEQRIPPARLRRWERKLGCSLSTTFKR